MTKQTNDFEATIASIATTRNISIEELADRIGATPVEFRRYPHCGFGSRLDQVVDLREEEKDQLVGAFVQTLVRR